MSAYVAVPHLVSAEVLHVFGMKVRVGELAENKLCCKVTRRPFYQAAERKSIGFVED
jgi:hypothetical protein